MDVRDSGGAVVYSFTPEQEFFCHLSTLCTKIVTYLPRIATQLKRRYFICFKM